MEGSAPPKLGAGGARNLEGVHMDFASGFPPPKSPNFGGL